MTPEQCTEIVKAEGWRRDFADDGDPFTLSWMHPPSHRVVTVDNAGSDEESPDWFAICRVHDELGNPVDGSMLGPFTYGEAFQRARAMRRAVLADKPGVAFLHEQLTLDDVLAKAG